MQKENFKSNLSFLSYARTNILIPLFIYDRYADGGGVRGVRLGVVVRVPGAGDGRGRARSVFVSHAGPRPRAALPPR